MRIRGIQKDWKSIISIVLSKLTMKVVMIKMQHELYFMAYHFMFELENQQPTQRVDGFLALYRTSEQKIDGIVEMHFEDRAAMDTALSSPEAKAMFADGTLFIETVTSFVVDPKVVIGE